MPIDPDLLELLACPSDDHAPLTLQQDAPEPRLVCSYCGSAFPIRDGIPVLLIDDALPGPNGYGRPAGD